MPSGMQSPLVWPEGEPRRETLGLPGYGQAASRRPCWWVASRRESLSRTVGGRAQGSRGPLIERRALPSRLAWRWEFVCVGKEGGRGDMDGV